MLCLGLAGSFWFHFFFVSIPWRSTSRLRSRGPRTPSPRSQGGRRHSSLELPARPPTGHRGFQAPRVQRARRTQTGGQSGWAPNRSDPPHHTWPSGPEMALICPWACWATPGPLWANPASASLDDSLRLTSLQRHTLPGGGGGGGCCAGGGGGGESGEKCFACRSKILSIQ